MNYGIYKTYSISYMVSWKMRSFVLLDSVKFNLHIFLLDRNIKLFICIFVQQTIGLQDFLELIDTKIVKYI